MTAYFDEAARRVAAVPITERQAWLDAVATIERVVIHNVVTLMSDEEFPVATRHKLEALFRQSAVAGDGSAAAWESKSSPLCTDLRACFRELAALRHATRFGVLSDCPIESVYRRNAYDRRPRPAPVAPTPALPAPTATPLSAAAAEARRRLAELRERLKLHDDRTAATYDEDHARKLRAEIHQLERPARER